MTDSLPTRTPTESNADGRRRQFNHETVTFEVEGVVHCVCRYGFEKWSRSGFCDMFSLPQGVDSAAEGRALDNPIRLEQCTNADFVSLLEVMYPELPLQPPSLEKDQWIGVLKLSRQWDMPQIAGWAIHKLSTAFTLRPVEKIMLGKAYSVPTWLKEGYVAVVQDRANASLEELSTLGWETACRIAWAQGELIPKPKTDPGWEYVAGGDIYCADCFWQDKSNPNKVVDGLDTCPYCNCKYGSEGYYVPPGSFRPSTAVQEMDRKAVEVEVEKVFEGELSHAKACNDGTPVFLAKSIIRSHLQL